MTPGTDIHIPHRIVCNLFSDPFTFPLVPSCGQNFKANDIRISHVPISANKQMLAC